MSTISNRWLTAAAVLAGLALATPAVAQREPERQAEPVQPRPAGEPAAREGQQPRTPAVAPGRAAAPTTREGMLAMLARKEAEHRERSAKLVRLREIAQAEGKTDRLAQIAELERKENAKQEALRTTARGVLGEDEFRRTEERLDRGRRRPAAVREAKEDRKEAAEATQDRKEAIREKGAEPKRDAPPAADRPQGDRPQGDRAPPPQQGERPKQDGDRKPADAQPGRGTSGTPQGGERPKPSEKPADKPAGRGGNPRSL